VSTESPLVDTPARCRSRSKFVIAAFIAAFFLSLFLDIPLSTWAHTSGLAPWLKFHVNVSGLNAPLKILIGRIRPYHGVPPFELHPFKFGLMSAEASFSFPSGDASLAFAMAMSLSLTIPRLRPLWWMLAVIVGLERIAENAHYPSDVVAGAALGVGVALLARKAVPLLLTK